MAFQDMSGQFYFESGMTVRGGLGLFFRPGPKPKSKLVAWLEVTQ